DWLVPKGEVGSPTNPGPFMEIPARMPGRALTPQPELNSPPLVTPEGTPLIGGKASPRGGNEGRAATWTNERVMQLAQQGNREAIAQATLRGMELPPNARYVAGDPNYTAATYNPRDITVFSPEGIPIRQSSARGSALQVMPQGKPTPFAQPL